MSAPAGARCESVSFNRVCGRPATHAYGPDCEAHNLMYLCAAHAAMIETWKNAHPNEPVECKEHGRIGKVKDHIALVAL